MERFMYEKAGAKAALLDELIAAGIADAVVEMDDERVWVTTAADKSLVDAAVAAHDPAAIDAAEELERQRRRDDAATLKAYRTTPKASITPSLTVDAIWALIDIMRDVVAELREGDD